MSYFKLWPLVAPGPQSNYLFLHSSFLWLITGGRTYPERLRRRDAAALVADSCASLWACNSPRSRYKAQPAPWLWCCRTYCLIQAARFIAEYGRRCSVCKFVILQLRREVGSSAILILCRASASPISPLLSTLRPPVCTLLVCGSDLSGHGLVSGRRGRSNKETDYPRSIVEIQTFYETKMITQISGHRLLF